MREDCIAPSLTVGLISIIIAPCSVHIWTFIQVLAMWLPCYSTKLRCFHCYCNNAAYNIVSLGIIINKIDLLQLNNIILVVCTFFILCINIALIFLLIMFNIIRRNHSIKQYILVLITVFIL